MPETATSKIAEASPKERALKLLVLLKRAKHVCDQAREAGFNIGSAAHAHDVPRDVFDAMRGEVHEWSWATDGVVTRRYWSRDLEGELAGSSIYTEEPPTSASDAPAGGT